MGAAIRTAISPFRRLKRGTHSNSVEFLDERLASMAVSGVPEEFRKLSRFLPVIVLVPRAAVRDTTTQKQPEPKSVACLTDTRDSSSWLDTAKVWLKNSDEPDMFEFGGVTVCFSTMEIHSNGRPITLTCKEFRTLTYLIKNARRVISRDELLNEVWGYQSYPCTRTVDNHILKLRKKLETDPTRPKHFHTVHGSGYKFLP